MKTSIIPANGQSRFDHILITNDDGIEDSDRLIALAKSVKGVADRVSIIVSVFDRSGTSNYTAYGKYQSTFEVTCEYLDDENNIAVYTLPSYPADCILLGVRLVERRISYDKPELIGFGKIYGEEPHVEKILKKW